jgi:hypothetical protein
MEQVYLAHDTRLVNRTCALAEMIDSFTDPREVQVAAPYTGLYSLDVLLDFDLLDGAAYQSKSGTLTLFGTMSAVPPPL